MQTKEQDLHCLGLASNEDQSALKKAYFKLALKRHPDKGGSKESFQTVFD
jgi:curved DNA-binding protein CbpA